MPANLIHLFFLMCCVVNSDVLELVDSQARFFNRNQFLDGVSEVERPFYEQVSFCWCTNVW